MLVGGASFLAAAVLLYSIRAGLESIDPMRDFLKYFPKHRGLACLEMDPNQILPIEYFVLIKKSKIGY